MSRCTRMHLLHAFSASVMKSLLFFPLDLKIWTNAVKHEPWTAAYSPLLKTRPPKTSHNALDKHLDPGRATPKWRIRAFTRERYHSCKKKKKKVRIWAPPNIPRSPLAWTELNSIYNDVLKPSLTSGKCKNVFLSAPLQLISKHFFYAIYRPPRILKPLRLYASLTLNWCLRRCIVIPRLTSDS